MIGRMAMWMVILFGCLFATCAGFYCLGRTDRTESRGTPAPQVDPPADPSVTTSESEDPKWNALREQFRKMSVRELVARARRLLNAPDRTQDSIREASMALAFADDRDHGRSDVRKLEKLSSDEFRALVDRDPVARREMEKTVREGMAYQLSTKFAGDGVFDSASDLEDSDGATLMIHGDRCSQEVVNVLALGKEGAELKKAGFHQISCIKSAFRFFDRDL